MGYKYLREMIMICKITSKLFIAIKKCFKIAKDFNKDLKICEKILISKQLSNNDNILVKELLNNLETFKLGIQVSDMRPLKVDSIYEMKRSNMYALFCKEIQAFIKIDKESFDKEFEKREVK